LPPWTNPPISASTRGGGSGGPRAGVTPEPGGQSGVRTGLRLDRDHRAERDLPTAPILGNEAACRGQGGLGHGDGRRARFLLDPYGLVVKAGVWYRGEIAVRLRVRAETVDMVLRVSRPQRVQNDRPTSGRNRIRPAGSTSS